MNDYPKMLYREGSAMIWEGKALDTITVESADDELLAREDGWQDAAEVHAPPASDMVVDQEQPRRGRPPKLTVTNA